MVNLQKTFNFCKVIIPFIIIGLTGCSIDKDKAVDRERFTFKIGDDTLLFFKNIRQSDYDLEDNEAAKLRVYRHEKRPVNDSIPYLSPAIVISILRDEAYILLEPSTILMDEDTLQVALVKDAAADTISIQTMNRENNLEFASRLYEHLQQAGSFYIRVNGKFEPFLTDNEIRESFRVTLADYYRLTRIY